MKNPDVAPEESGELRKVLRTTLALNSTYVVAGRLGQRTPNGVNHVEAGHTMNGRSADIPMEVFNSGTTELAALIMFVVDATRPFSSPAKFP